MPTGFASGVDVVDIDVHASGSGFDALQLARSAGLPGTPAWVVSTPSGGMHACFLRTGSVAQRSWQVPGRHVDFRGDGGYVVLPPSTVVQPDGEARPYRVVNVATRQPDAVDADALRRFLEPPRPTRPPVDLPNLGARPDRLASWVATRSEGERNRGLGSLSRATASLSQALRQLGSYHDSHGARADATIVDPKQTGAAYRVSWDLHRAGEMLGRRSVANGYYSICSPKWVQSMS